MRLLGRSAILTLGIVILSACGGSTRDDAAPKVVKAQGNVAVTFGNVFHVPSTPYFTVPIVEARPNDARPYFSSYEGAVERNRLIGNAATGRSRKLLSDNSRVIVRWFGSEGSTGPYSAGPQQPNTPSFNMNFAAVVSDRLGENDRRPPQYDLLLGSFATDQQVWVGRQLDGVADVWTRSDGTVATIVTKEGHAYFRAYSLETFALLLETELIL